MVRRRTPLDEIEGDLALLLRDDLAQERTEEPHLAASGSWAPALPTERGSARTATFGLAARDEAPRRRAFTGARVDGVEDPVDPAGREVPGAGQVDDHEVVLRVDPEARPGRPAVPERRGRPGLRARIRLPHPRA